MGQMKLISSQEPRVQYTKKKKKKKRENERLTPSAGMVCKTAAS